MYCKKCGQRVKDTENVCGKCGAVNQSAYYPKFTEDLCYCPECGRQVSREDKFCTKCGVKLNLSSAANENFAVFAEKKEMKASPLSRWSYMPHFDNFAPAEEEKPTEESAQPKAEEENTETVAPIPPIGENIKAEPVEPTPMEEAPAEEDLNESPAPMQEEITDDSENISDYGGGILGSAVAAHGYRQEAVPNNEVVPNASALHRALEKSYDEPKRSVQSAEGISAEDEPNENFKNISEEVPAPEKEVEQPSVFKQATVSAPIAPAAQPKAEEPAAEQQSAPQPAAAEKPARTESAKPNSFAAPRTEQKAPVQAAPSKPYYNEIALDKRKDLENYSEPEKKQPAHMPLETDVIATKPREYKDKKGFGIVAIIFAILLPPLGIVLGIVAISRGWTTMNKTYSRLGTAAIIIGVIATIAFSFALIKWIIPAITELINNKRNSMFLFM